MALSPAARLGPYEIVSMLGAGGMGEVYRARDTRLDRTVVNLQSEDVIAAPLTVMVDWMTGLPSGK